MVLQASANIPLLTLKQDWRERGDEGWTYICGELDQGDYRKWHMTISCHCT